MDYSNMCVCVLTRLTCLLYSVYCAYCEESNLDVYFGRFIDVHAETSKLALILDVTWTSIFGPSLGKYVFLPFTIHVADHKNNTTIFNTVS